MYNKNRISLELYNLDILFPFPVLSIYLFQYISTFADAHFVPFNLVDNTTLIRT